MLEAVDQVAQDREPNPAMYRMLTGALHTLATTRNPLVTPAFFWKLLSLEGFHPLLDGCARCGEPDEAMAGEGIPGDHELVAFDLEEGGTVCRACARGGGRSLTPEGLSLLRRGLGGGLGGALAESPGPAPERVGHLGVRAPGHHVERRVRSGLLLRICRETGPHPAE